MTAEAESGIGKAQRPRSAMLALVASKIRTPSSPSVATRAKSDGLADSRLGGEHDQEPP
jgi:hypothetical protein